MGRHWSLQRETLFQAAKANLEHFYPNVINVGTAEEIPASTQHSERSISERLLARASRVCRRACYLAY